MREFRASRSRTQSLITCPRLRYWGSEYQGSGLELRKTALPLAVGGSFHKGVESLLARCSTAPKGKFADADYAIDSAVDIAIEEYDIQCRDRELDIDALEASSHAYNEQRALTEALMRLAGLRVIPRLLETYEILEVEVQDRVALYRFLEDKCPKCQGHGGIKGVIDCPECKGTGEGDSWEILWRSIPDALMRKRDDGELYLLSWKTTSDYSQRVDQAARVDNQGLSEAWAWEAREHAKCGRQVQCIVCGLRKKPRGRSAPLEMANSLCDHECPGYDQDPEPGELWPGESRKDFGYNLPKIRGIQYAYLIKGLRREASTGETQALNGGSGEKVMKTNSPLIYGWGQDLGGLAPMYALTDKYVCPGPHPMRKSQWYPTGECPGGRRHERQGDWKSFPVWSAMGVKSWMAMIAEGRVQGLDQGDPLEALFALPVPQFRTDSQAKSWLTQTRAREIRVAQGLMALEAAQDKENALDEHFPQDTSKCYSFYGRSCPMVDLCHGPEHVAQDPLGSGIYQVRKTIEDLQVKEVENA